ncbi:MAG: hypothetical protein H6747_13075 [Deltaproteobacteria bacterium]|nr:hypothetical protein [Deltaproteobacteria bacterium]
MYEAKRAEPRRRWLDYGLLCALVVAAQGCSSAAEPGSDALQADAVSDVADTAVADAAVSDVADAAVDAVETVDTAADAIETVDAVTAADAAPDVDDSGSATGCGGGPACDPGGDTPCLAVACKDGACALLPRNEGVPCDDGNPCILETTCQAGSCGGGFVACGCLDDADCAGIGAADLCAGPSVCDKKQWPWTCASAPGGAVQCDPKDDTACAAASCQPATGTCALLPLPDATACDDGDACTGGDHCKAGTCVAGPTDLCGCGSDADCDSKEDGDLCNGTLYCDLGSGSCKLNPATVVSCPTGDDAACAAAVCYPKSGLCQLTPVEKLVQGCKEGVCTWALPPPGTATKTAVACDDGEACTIGDVCAGGVCVAGKDVCFCTQDADCGGLEDGNACNGTLFCNKQSGGCELDPTSKVVCPSVGDTECAVAACVPKSGQCLPAPIGSALKVCDGAGPNPCRYEHKQPGSPETKGLPCTDGDPCTIGEACAGGKCDGGSYVCQCASDADCAGKEDGDVCNGTLYCDKTGSAPVCKVNPSTVVVCAKKSESPCLQDTCNPKDGSCAMAPANAGGACDDGNACTAKDQCAGGVCQGAPISCDDGNACSVDACTPSKGCSHTFALCDDGNACTADTCVPATGLCSFPTAPKDGAPCVGDGDGCTLADQCKQGVCTVGPKVACKVGELGVCEVAVCVSTSATSHLCKVGYAASGTACDDGKPCTIGTTCDGNGSCAGKYSNKLFAGYHVGPRGEGMYRAAALHENGDFAAAGATYKSGDNTSYWWVSRISPGGSHLWQVQHATGKKQGQGASAVLTTAAGETIAAGGVADPGGLFDMAVVRWDSKGTVVANWQIQGADDEDAKDVVRTTSGTTLVAGHRTKSGQRHLRLVLLDGTGKTVWIRDEPSPLGNVWLAGALQRADGSLAVAATGVLWQGFDKPVVYRPAVWTYDLAGVPASMQSYPALADTQLESLRERDGALLLGGTTGLESGGANTAWVAALRDDLGLRWANAISSASTLYDFDRGPGGRLAVAGARRYGSKTACWTAATDRFANEANSAGLSTGDEGWMTAVVAMPDGGRFMVGQRYYKSHWRGQFWRTDGFGNASCGAAGGCAEAGTCDDGKDCTLDGCSAAGGCSHVAETAVLCDPENGCALVGSCDAKGCAGQSAGRLWQRSEKIGDAGSQPAGAIALGDGDLASFGQARFSGQDRAFLQRRDGYGGHRWTAQWAIAGKPAAAVAAAALGDSDAVVASRGGDGTTIGDLRRLDPNGGVVWQKNVNFLTKYSPLAVRVFADTSIGLALEPNSGDLARVLLVRYAPDTVGLIWPSGFADPLPLGSLGGQPFRPWRSATGIGLGAAIWGPAVAGTADGSAADASWIAGGKTTGAAGTKVEAFVGVVDVAGKLKWSKTLGLGQKASSYFLGVAARSDGGGYAVGARNESVQTGWLVRLSPTGAVLWERTFAGYGHAFNAAITLPGGDLLASGSTISGGKQRPLLVHESASGGLGWQRVENDRVGYANGLSLYGQGDLVRTFSVGPNQQLELRRTDPWGHAGCSEAGGCLQPPKGCDDGKPCTVDACLQGSCQHSPVPCGS